MSPNPTPNGRSAPSRRELLRGAQLVAVAALVGCRKRSTDDAKQGPSAASVKQSLDELRKRLDEQKKKFMALREQVDALPADMPGFGDVRVNFYATEEGRGTTDGKAVWLAGQLEAAIKSGNRDELEQVSKDIAATHDDIRKIDDLHVKLLHQVMAFERMARRAQEPEKPPEKAPEKPSATKARSPKPKP